MNSLWTLLWVLGVSGAVWLAAGGVAWLADRCVVGEDGE
jgi:hypothetical protein